jgi:putative methylase
VRKADLERILEAVPRHPAPDPDLEQYRTPARIAAELLLAAHADGAIAGRRVLDLGSGTGTFVVGAARLGARLATGVEADADAVALAHGAVAAAGVQERAWLVTARLEDWHPEAGAFDTVVMNPPFGAQKGNKHADRLFLQRAAEAVRPQGTVWFLALERTERFLTAYAGELGARIERVAAWDYPLEATMAHHRRDVQTVRVGGYRLSWAH